ncbi:HypC/HybG/HupF family hydrogenase formation chaperone [Veillonella rogosae]|uniref:HypC/HybG/HupF family hydrogenase formation chaperone n=1 Tax=Veillonella rogosae TaxID=423477 RepID=UPI0006D1E824|nr:HypC/HybG/HupF family hydrogenase formation chaperone [Veillonella rogosae]
MCLAVPARLIAVNDAIGTVELTGATRDCSLLLVPEAKVGGDWLLVHAGFAVQIVDEEEAQKTLEAFKELEELEEAYFAGKAEHS